MANNESGKSEYGHLIVSSTEHKIDIPKDLQFPPQPQYLCICKVPRTLRETKPAAYTPQLISIGPFHIEDEHLMEMGKHKYRYLEEFCRFRTERTQEELFLKVRECQKRIYSCYEQCSSTPCDDNFVKIILLDAVFIIELFLKSEEADTIQSNGFILNRPLLSNILNRDLILLENQLPFFLLEDLYDFAVKSPKRSFFQLTCRRFEQFISPPKVSDGCDKNLTSRCRCSCNCFSCLYCFWMRRRFSCQCLDCRQRLDCCNKNLSTLVEKYEAEHEKNKEQRKKRGTDYDFKAGIKHFTDLIRKFLSDNHPELKVGGNSITHLPSATKLHAAGVVFKVDARAWPLDVKYHCGELIMPKIVFEDYTECLIRNLMALEQCYYPHEAYICNHILLMDYLIDTKKDVELLTERGVIENLLGYPKPVVEMLNGLCQNIAEKESGYFLVAEKLNKHCDNCWYNSIATLRTVYFDNIWRGTGTIAAFLVIVLTFINAMVNLRKLVYGY